MSERTSHAPGTICWVDLSTPDVDAAAEFYGALFGWEVPELPNSAEMGGYRRAKQTGKDVAGVYPLMEAGQHPAWATYVSVSDAAATAAAVKANGGDVIVEPMDIGMGHMAVFSDPAGGIFGAWQPGTFAGAELVGEPGAVVWNELNTRDPNAAKEFYGAVFGWTFIDQHHEQVGTYTEIMLGEQMVGGIFDIAGVLPDEVPQNWMVYFGADDVDAVARAAADAGGQVPSPPEDMPGGRFAIVMDPAGAVFGVLKMEEDAAA
jgi:predicted enzyme related to lactoylglutathione lyase